MKINYELTSEDCKIYIKETFFINRLLHYFIKDNAIIFALILSLSFACVLLNFNTTFIIILLIIICGLSYYSSRKYAYRLLDGFDKNYELTVERDIIRRTSGSGESSFTWDNVKDIYNTKENILIFVSDRQAMVVPKRVFNSEQEVDDFWNFVSECYQSNKNM